MDIPTIVMIVLASVAVLAVFCIFVWLYLITPGSSRRERMEKYKAVKFAHRGLHDGGRAENSISAFRAAKDAGFGIELDVRLAKDGTLVVFHDPTLDRVCGVQGRVIDRTADELSELRLSNTADGIPTFHKVLQLIDGAVPLLIEIKQDTDEAGVAEALVRELEGYKGDYIVESFNPLALRKIKKLRPNILRGILSCEFSKQEKYRGKLLYSLLERLLLNFLMRPDFIAYDMDGHAVPNLRFIRRTFGTPLFAWTVRSPEDEAKTVSCGFDTVIFENYIPTK